MTKTTKYPLHQRRANFDADFNALDNDFPVADVPIAADDNRFTITPLSHAVDDDDAIDRLLMDTGFDFDIPPSPLDKKRDAAFPVTRVEALYSAEPNNTIDEFEITHEVTAQPFNSRNSTPESERDPIETVEPPTFMIHPEAEFLEPDSHETAVESVADPAVLMTDTDVQPRQTIKAKAAKLNTLDRKRPPQANQTQKTGLVSAAALGLAILALVSIVVLSMMVTELKRDVAKLTALLEIVKDDVETLTEK
jgi:hypothetical protein